LFDLHFLHQNRDSAAVTLAGLLKPAVLPLYLQAARKARRPVASLSRILKQYIADW
jgi:hypothetical protein